MEEIKIFYKVHKINLILICKVLFRNIKLKIKPLSFEIIKKNKNYLYFFIYFSNI